VAYVIEMPKPPAGERDLAANAPGALTRRKREQAHAVSPLWQVAAWFLGVRSDDRSWRLREHGELTVAAQLEKLGSDWRVLHSIEVTPTTDIDHLVIGPGGVFALSARCHPKSQATVNERAVKINGQPTKYLGKSREASLRAAHSLSVGCRRRIDVHAAIVFVDLNRLVIDEMPDGVHVTTYRRLTDWLRSHSPVMTAGQVEELYAKARASATWI
jgi:hypothetical protein